MKHNHSCQSHAAHAGPSSGEVIDPVCGMRVDPATAKHRAKHDGGEYYFCSAKCRERFEARPEIFLGDAPAVVPQGSKDLIYTCPMHPEIEQVGPGTCPICGMALEPKGAALPEGPSEEYLDMRRRFVVSALLSVPLVLVAMLQIGRASGRERVCQSFSFRWSPYP